jgi:hypothetical protein
MQRLMDLRSGIGKKGIEVLDKYVQESGLTGKDLRKHIADMAQHPYPFIWAGYNEKSGGYVSPYFISLLI